MEINIKRKKKPVWPWIVAILIILAILFVLYTQFGDEVEQQLDNSNDETSYVIPKIKSDEDAHPDVMLSPEDIAYYDEVKDFINFVEHNNYENPELDYTERATIYLAQALSKMVDLEHTGDASIEAKRDQLLSSIEILKNDSTSARHDVIGQAFTYSAELMSAMQKKDYPALQPQVNNVERLAKSIHPDNLVTEKEFYVKEFFLVSKVALKAISEIDTY